VARFSASIPVTASALLALLVLLAGCGKDPAPTAAVPALTITTTRSQAQELDRAVVVSGSVAAWQEMSLGVELTGLRIEQVLVEVGDDVRAGQPLLRLDARTLAVRARQAAAALAQAQASLTLARSESARGEQLLERRLISTSDAEQLKANLISAEAQVATAEADNDSARLNLGFATLVAPHAGIISARNVQPGAIVTAGAELLRLIRDGRLEWRAELPEKDLLRVREGTAIELTGPDGTLATGRVRAVSPALDPNTRTALVYADLTEPGQLRAGMFAQGRIVLGHDEVSVLPRESIVYRDGLPYVYVVGKAPPGADTPALGSVRQQRVTIGDQQGEFLEVVSGITSEQLIAVRGAGFLNDGDLVRLAPSPTAAARAQP